jgi:hypothetical protein
MLNMPAVSTGFSPKRWQQTASVMLENDKGDPKIFKADYYTLFLKLIWECHMVKRAE